MKSLKVKLLGRYNNNWLSGKWFDVVDDEASWFVEEDLEVTIWFECGPNI